MKLIIDMAVKEIPSKCNDCPLQSWDEDDSEDYCMAARKFIYQIREGKEECPIIGKYEVTQ